MHLLKNFFSEKNKILSKVNIKSLKLNKFPIQTFSPRVISAVSFKNNNNQKNKSFKLTLKNNTDFHSLTSHPLKKTNSYINIAKSKIFSVNKLPINKRTLSNKNSTKISLRKNRLNEQKNFTQIEKEKKETKAKDENIESLLSEVINWDNKQLIENNEQFKDAKIYCEKEKDLLNFQRIISESSINYSKKNNEKNKRTLSTLSYRFSAFNIDNYAAKKFNPNIKKENESLKNEKNKSNDFIDNEKAYSKFETSNLDRLMKIYEYVKINKVKKKKYKEVIDSTYNLLYQAKKECELSVDLLKERIKALQKYYEAYIKSYSKIKDSKDSKDRKIKLYEEKIIKYREYLSIYDEISAEIKKYEDNYNEIKTDLESFINKIRNKVEIITNEINKYKYLFNELKEQQTNYYLEKLKSGTDTRTEGLCWIVKKLMELNVEIRQDLFPGFLDMEQIDFLIKISKLDFELQQLRILFKTFKEKKKDLLDVKNIDEEIIILRRRKRKAGTYKKFNIEDKALVDDINFDIDFESCFNEFLKEKGIVNKKILHLLRNHSRKTGFSTLIKYKTEDNKLNDITSRIRKKMNIYAQTYDNDIFKHIKKHEVKIVDRETQYLKDYGLISERIEKLDELIERLKKEEYLIFKEKIKLFSENERKKSFDIIYNALFGKIIFDIESKYKMILSKEK